MSVHSRYRAGLWHPYEKPMYGVFLNPYHPLARGLVGCWLFNEGGGNIVYDLSGHINHGTLGGGTASYCPDWITGKFGSALSFDGSNDYVSISSLNLGIRNTLAIWVKYTSSDTSHTLPLGSGELTRYYFYRYPSAMYFKLNGSPSNYSYVAPLDKWLFLVWVRNNMDADLYVDGKFHSTVTNTDWDGIDTLITEFGRAHGDSSLSFQGTLSCIMFWNLLLNAEEIWQLYTDPFCMFYHPLEAELLYAAAPSAVSSPTLTLLGVGR